MIGDAISTKKPVKIRGKWEKLGLLLLIAVSCILFLAIYVKKWNLKKAKIMSRELETLNMMVAAYKITTGQFPETLIKAVQSACSDGGDCIFIPVNSGGEFLDPFGKPYEYDRRAGRIVGENFKEAASRAHEF